ncbi:MAG: tetratricopeptide repeat protein [Lachnospiraceae bacterium]|nr:tetratricopeptide repeat protein [Lachnospiraceae bacterium]
MNCNRCNSPLGADRFCSNCGLSHRYIKKACNTADYYYNTGLERAKLRDLTGAKEALEKALFYNKYHIEARNLLGLIFYETGEIIEALRQWVYSINYEDVDNPAERYLSELQIPGFLDDLSQMVKKYNLAVQYAQQGSEDLALIQVKKVVSSMPRFVNARLLLAVLYMKLGKNDEAKKQLEKVLRIDSFHPDAVRYYKELTGDRPSIVRSRKAQSDTAAKKEKPSKKQELGRYMEPVGNNKSLILTLIIGIVIGVAAMWVLVMPNQKFNVNSDYKTLQVEYKETVAAKDATIKQLEEDKATLETENAALTGRLEVYAGVNGGEGMYDAILKASSLYASGDKIGAAKALLKVDETRLESDTAKSMYTKIKQDTFASSSQSLYDQGYAKYNNYKYSEALTLFKDAYDLNNQNADALYFLARSYHRMNDNENAIANYKKVVETFPNTERASDAVKKLRELGVTIEQPAQGTTEAN